VPETGDWEGYNPLASGLFGSFQAGAAASASTADIWRDLRINAATFAWQAQGGGERPSDDELEAMGRPILSAAGIGIQQVNTYRAIAGQWQKAKANLASLNDDEQVGRSAIFVPPWAQTGANGVDARYRVRVNWEVTPSIGDVFTKWSSYEITAPVASISDALEQAGAKAAGDKYLYLLSGGAPLGISDYQVEQI
jgi:hypothetical protein